MAKYYDMTQHLTLNRQTHGVHLILVQTVWEMILTDIKELFLMEGMCILYHLSITLTIMAKYYDMIRHPLSLIHI